eukprot:Nk52_evm68s2039 gene=Nk52_evmTU68s2039
MEKLAELWEKNGGLKKAGKTRSSKRRSMRKSNGVGKSCKRFFSDKIFEEFTLEYKLCSPETILELFTPPRTPKAAVRNGENEANKTREVEEYGFNAESALRAASKDFSFGQSMETIVEDAESSLRTASSGEYANSRKAASTSPVMDAESALRAASRDHSDNRVTVENLPATDAENTLQGASREHSSNDVVVASEALTVDAESALRAMTQRAAEQSNEESQMNEENKDPLKRLSSLNSAAQARFASLDAKLRATNGQGLLLPELNEFHELNRIVSAEQAVFRQALKAASMNHRSNYFYIPEHMELFLKEWMVKKTKNSSPVGIYSVKSTLGLALGPPLASEPVMLNKGLIKKIDKLGDMKTPSPWSVFQDADVFCLDQKAFTPSDLCNFESVDEKIVFAKGLAKKELLPRLENDPSVAEILAQHEVDIVLSSGTFKYLIDNQPPTYGAQWEIPLIVEEKEHPYDKEKKVKFVYLEKPLLKKTMTCREKSKVYYNKAVREMLSLNSKRNSTIGKNEDGYNSSDEEEQDLELVLDEDMNEEHSEVSNSKEREASEGLEGVNYNIWSFGNMNVLVRSKSDGIWNEKLKDPKGEEISVDRPVCVKTKLHYQYSTLGCLEQPTVSENARWWAHLFLRPNSLLVIAHIDPVTEKLLYLEKKTMGPILSPMSGFKPGPSMKKLRTILQMASSVTQGKYIICHRPGDPHVTLYEETFSVGSSNGSEELEKKSKGSIGLKPFGYDVKSALSGRGMTDEVDEAYIELASTKSMTGVVPFLFPPPPPASPKKRNHRNKRNGKKDSKKKQKKCFKFLKTGKCARGSNCKMAHITQSRRGSDEPQKDSAKSTIGKVKSGRIEKEHFDFDSGKELNISEGPKAAQDGPDKVREAEGAFDFENALKEAAKVAGSA